MLVDLLLQAARRSPGALAVDDTLRSLTYKRLTVLASVLRDVVRRRTDCPRIGIMLPASAAFPATLFGVLWASRTAVPLNFLLGPDQLSSIVEDAAIDRILTVKHFKNACADLPAEPLFLEDLSLKRRMVLAALRRLPPPPVVEPDNTAVILYTSGTTAEPKGVELTHRNLYTNTTDAIEALGISPPQTCLNILPPFHIFGLTGTVLVPVALAATVHAIPRFNPVAAVNAVQKHGVTLLLAIPSMYAAMLRTKSAPSEAFGTVRLAISGGEPLSERVRQDFEERFRLTLKEGYGLTETSPIVAASSIECHRSGTVGRIIKSVRVRIVDPEGNDLPCGQRGEILVTGPGVMKGYYRKPDETARVIDAGGWFHTGDIGCLDDDGYLAITGRAKEMLIIGGENVFPREIEAALESHDDVFQAAVIGVPDDLRGELPVAFVIPRPGAETDESALRQHARRTLPTFKVPKRILIRDDLPQSPTGKILKRKLPGLIDHAADASA